MRVVRRFYFYAISFISLEVVLWGVITLLNSITNAPVGGGIASLLARGFSQILVGLPIFLLHWSVIRRDLQKDPEEHQTLLRAIFTYGLQMATLIPIFTNLHAIIRRPLFDWLQVYPLFQNFLAGKNFLDNLISILSNLVVFYFAITLLKKDQALFPNSTNIENIRRIYRYTWFGIGLSSLVVGLQQVLYSIFYLSNGLGNSTAIKLANGTSVTLISAGIWFESSRQIDKSLVYKHESNAILRTIVLYITNFTAIGFVLVNTGMVIYSILTWLLGAGQTFASFFNSNAGKFSILIPMIVVWVYYGRALKDHFAVQPDILIRDRMQRIYYYILSLAGNVAVFYGVWILLQLIADLLTGQDILSATTRNTLAEGVAILAVSLPIWLQSWSFLQNRVKESDERADHARQSVIRKAYLYLIIFASVVGLMAAGGILAYQLINSALGNPFDNLGQFVVRKFFLIGLITVWLIYHLRVLRSDGRKTQQALIQQHAAFKTTVLTDNETDPTANQLVAMLNKKLPDIPVTLQVWQNDPNWKIAEDTCTLIIPASMLKNETISEQFKGKIVVLPDPSESYTWVGVPAKNQDEILQDAVRVIRQLAEGEEARSSGPVNAWITVGYILGAIFALQILLVLFSLLMNTID
jgi:hypothetical protein